MHGTYTEKLQINEQIKQYTVYTSTVNRRSHVLVDRYERSISQMSIGHCVSIHLSVPFYLWVRGSDILQVRNTPLRPVLK